MITFLKKVAKGILCIFILPALLVIIGVYSIVGVCVFLYLGFKAIILFFQGKNLFGDLDEDILAKEILQGKSNQKQETTVVEVFNSPTQSYTTSPMPSYEQPIINNRVDEIEDVTSNKLIEENINNPTEKSIEENNQESDYNSFNDGGDIL